MVGSGGGLMACPIASAGLPCIGPMVRSFGLNMDDGIGVAGRRSSGPVAMMSGGPMVNEMVEAGPNPVDLFVLRVADVAQQTVSIRPVPSADLVEFCRVMMAQGARYIDVIWPYCDTMFNIFQLTGLAEDIGRLAGSASLDPGPRAAGVLFLDAVVAAHRVDGYLWVEGPSRITLFEDADGKVHR